MTRDEFIASVAKAARRVRDKGGAINTLGTVAHAINETGGGQSGLFQQANNIWGVKKGRSWTGPTVTMDTWEVIDGRNVTVAAEFRKYPDIEAATWDYAKLIERLYPHAAASKDSTVGFLNGLFRSEPYRWATDPRAFEKVLAIANDLEGRLPTESPPHRGEVDVLRLNHIPFWDRWRLAWQLVRGVDVPTLSGGFFFGRHPLANGEGHKLDVSKKA